jgi:hypothetical protein
MTPADHRSFAAACRSKDITFQVVLLPRVREVILTNAIALFEACERAGMLACDSEG